MTAYGFEDGVDYVTIEETAGQTDYSNLSTRRKDHIITLSMAKELSMIQRTEKGKVRTVLVDGEPWFVLADVCKVLGMTNVTETKKRLDQHDFSTTEVTDSIGRKRQAGIVNESGMYDVVLRRVGEHSHRRERMCDQRIVTIRCP